MADDARDETKQITRQGRFDEALELVKKARDDLHLDKMQDKELLIKLLICLLSD